MKTQHLDCDVVILGSGFSGSLLGSILRKSGMRVAAIDHRSHPRFAIGESSTPTADRLLSFLIEKYGLSKLKPLTRFGTWREQRPEVDCGCKQGFSYFRHSGEGGFTSTIEHENEMLVAASDSRVAADCHWNRAEVDHFFCTMRPRIWCDDL